MDTRPPLPTDGRWRVGLVYTPLRQHLNGRVLLVPATASWDEDAKALHAIALMSRVDMTYHRFRVATSPVDAGPLRTLLTEAFLELDEDGRGEILIRDIDLLIKALAMEPYAPAEGEW